MALPCSVYIDIRDEISNLITKVAKRLRFITEHSVLKAVKRNRNLQIGDFQVPIPVSTKLDQTEKEKIVATFIEEAKLQGIPVSSAAWNDDRNIFITLDRSALFREVLQQVHRQGDNYGKQSASCSDDKTLTDFIVLNNSDLFHADQSEAVQLVSIRSALITECLFNLLKAYGYNILSTSTTLCQTYAEVLKRFGINSHQGNLEQQPNCTGEDFLHCLTSSKYSEQSLPRLSDSNSHLSNTNTSSTTQHEHYTRDVQPGSNCDNPSPSAGHQSLHVDVLAYLKDHNLHVGKGGYEKGLTPVPVLLKDQFTKKYMQAVHLQKSIENLSVHSWKTCRCVHITSKAKSYTQQQVDVLWRMLCPVSVNQEHVVFGPVTTSDGTHISADQFFSLRREQMKKAFVIKYGAEVAGEGWDQTITAMTQAVVKFELLSITYKNQVKLELNQNSELGGPVEDKGGTFVMYNCSRLSTLFQHFNQYVEEGVYDALEDIEKTDFSLLKEEDEWSLMFNYILHYPDVVKDSVTVGDSTHSQMKTHKICSFLLDLSRDLSTYYRKVRILREARPHLQPSMFARLHLLKSLQQVMHNALSLLSITPPTQM